MGLHTGTEYSTDKYSYFLKNVGLITLADYDVIGLNVVHISPNDEPIIDLQVYFDEVRNRVLEEVQLIFSNYSLEKFERLIVRTKEIIHIMIEYHHNRRRSIWSTEVERPLYKDGTNFNDGHLFYENLSDNEFLLKYHELGFPLDSESVYGDLEEYEQLLVDIDSKFSLQKGHSIRLLKEYYCQYWMFYHEFTIDMFNEILSGIDIYLDSNLKDSNVSSIKDKRIYKLKNLFYSDKAFLIAVELLQRCQYSILNEHYDLVSSDHEKAIVMGWFRACKETKIILPLNHVEVTKQINEKLNISIDRTTVSKGSHKSSDYEGYFISGIEKRLE